MVHLNPANLVVIDGRGDLVSQLKRKVAVTRLLGEQLLYIDMDSASFVGGFNPLAAVPGENAKRQVQHWQRWFQGMAVPPQGIQLLIVAQQEGVGDIPSLRQWLKQKERQGPYTAVASLNMALNHLTATKSLREWLEWPTNPYGMLPQGALFFACQGTSWERQQLLRAVFLAVSQVANLRVVVHGFPWKMMSLKDSDWPEQLVSSNGPTLTGALTLLVETSVAQTKILVDRFLGADSQLAENLALLQRGEGIFVHGDCHWPVFWKSPPTI
jgi:hypothetical protein